MVEINFLDPLAEALWKSRLQARTLDGRLAAEEPQMLQANRIADELYRAVGESGAVQIGWKFGATNAGAQRRLGTSEPFVAPIFTSTRIPNGGTVSLSRFAQPRIEAEIGVVIDGTRLLLTPCIEIADCHFPEWRISIGCAIADFGLHGLAVFGDSVMEPPSDGLVRVNLQLNGSELVSGEESVALTVERVAQLLSSRAHYGLIATGRMTELLPLRAGLWVADFGDLGIVGLTVVA